MYARAGAAAQKSAGLGRVKWEPFVRARSIFAYRMNLPLFIPVVIINLLILSAVLIAYILVLQSVFTHWDINSADYNDAQSYSLLVLTAPLMMLAALFLLGAMAGRLLFVDFFQRLAFFLVASFLYFIGLFGGIVAMIVSFGRHNACLNNQSSTDFCHDEQNALLAVGLISVALVVLALLDWVLSLLMLFVLQIQYSAIGMDTETIRQMQEANTDGAKRTIYKEWLAKKRAGDYGGKSVDESVDSSLVNDDAFTPAVDVTAAAIGEVRPVHRAVARTAAAGY